MSWARQSSCAEPSFPSTSRSTPSWTRPSVGCPEPEVSTVRCTKKVKSIYHLPSFCVAIGHSPGPHVGRTLRTLLTLLIIMNRTGLSTGIVGARRATRARPGRRVLENALTRWSGVAVRSRRGVHHRRNRRTRVGHCCRTVGGEGARGSQERRSLNHVTLAPAPRLSRGRTPLLAPPGTTYAAAQFQFGYEVMGGACGRKSAESC